MSNVVNLAGEPASIAGNADLIDQLEELLARVRTELGPLWERYTAERPAAAPGGSA